ncbi:MAG: peroxiredoxin [Mariprofundus sp.]
MSEHIPANEKMATQVQRAIVKIVIAVFLVSVLPMMVIISLIVADGKPIEVGSEAPEFTLFNQFHQQVHSTDLKGWWFVYFCSADGRPECLIQARYFRDHYESFETNKLKLIGITYDQQATHRTFSVELKLNYDLLSDPNGDVIEDYSADTSMHRMARNLAYLIDEQGLVRRVYHNLEPAIQLEYLNRDMPALKL